MMVGGHTEGKDCERVRELAVSFGTTDWLHMTPILHDIVFLWFTMHGHRVGRGKMGRTDETTWNVIGRGMQWILYSCGWWWLFKCLTLPLLLLLLLVGGRWIECPAARLQSCPSTTGISRSAGKVSYKWYVDYRIELSAAQHH